MKAEAVSLHGSQPQCGGSHKPQVLSVSGLLANTARGGENRLWRTDVRPDESEVRHLGLGTRDPGEASLAGPSSRQSWI